MRMQCATSLSKSVCCSVGLLRWQQEVGLGPETVRLSCRGNAKKCNCRQASAAGSKSVRLWIHSSNVMCIGPHGMMQTARQAVLAFKQISSNTVVSNSHPISTGAFTFLDYFELNN